MNKLCEETGKRCFSSKGEARKAIRKLGARLRTYVCPFCHMHHLTKKTDGEKTLRGDRRREE